MQFCAVVVRLLAGEILLAVAEPCSAGRAWEGRPYIEPYGREYIFYGILKMRLIRIGC